MEFSYEKSDLERREFWKNAWLLAAKVNNCKSCTIPTNFANGALEQLGKKFNTKSSSMKDLFTEEEIAEAFGTSVTEFNYDSNLYFDTIKSLDDLEKLFSTYEGHMTRDEILDKSRNYSEDSVLYTNPFANFGLRTEHRGNTTLRQFLINLGFDQFKKIT